MSDQESNRRFLTFLITLISVIFLVVILLSGLFITESLYAPDFSKKNLPPSMTHPFGTDFMGRNMFYRTIKGLSISMVIGFCGSTVSCMIALIFGFLASTFGKKVDLLICGLIDLMRSIPSILFLILISVATGRGIWGVTIAVILTHWTTLCRILRGELLALKNTKYYKTSQRIGKSNFWIAKNHIVPHLLPHLIVGLILLFPHAIMSEATLTFLGFGVPSEIPAVGGILEESMQYLISGAWWLAAFPGLCLLFVVLLFEMIGDNIRRLLDPFTSQE